MLINGSYRDSKRVDKSDLFLPNAAPTTGSGAEIRQKIGTAEGSWVIDADELRDVQVHALREPVARAARTTSPTSPSTRRSARASTSPTWTRSGRVTVPSPVAGQTAFNDVHPAAHRPLRLRR